MKEATGELNMTVVTIVAIGAIVAFFYLLIWPTIKVNMALTTACNSSNGEGYTLGGEGEDTITCSNGSCTFTPAGGGSPTTRECTQER